MSNPSAENQLVPRGLAVTAAWGWRLLILALAVTIVAVMLWELRTITVPVFIAILLSTLLLPPTRWLERKGLRPAAAVGIVFAVAVGLIAVIIWLLSSPVAEQFSQLGPELSSAIDQVKNWLITGPLNLSEDQISGYIEQASASLRDNASSLQTGVVTSATVIGEVLVALVVTIILTFFFTKDGDKMSEAIINVFPADRREVLHRAAHRAFSVLGGYLRGIAATGLVDAVLIGIALAIIGVPLLLPLVVLTFFAAFIPVVGATAAGGLAALVALVNGGPTDALLVILAVLIVQQVESHLLQPFLVGRAVALHPVIIISALVVGSLLIGLLGALLAVPLTAMIIGVIREVTDNRPAEVAAVPGGGTD